MSPPSVLLIKTDRANKKKQRPKKTHLVLQKQDSIGEPGAEEDENLLESCFFSSPVYDIMGTIDNPKCILIGGTGAGKTAFIEQFHRNNSENCVRLNLDEMSLNYLSNSNTLNNLEELGINLNVIYQYLWRHLLVILLIKKKFKITELTNNNTPIQNFMNRITQGSVSIRARNYLSKLEDEFWLEPKDCIEQTTKELVNQFEGGLNLATIGSLKGEDIRSIKSNKTEVSKYQRAVNDTQIQILSEVLKFLNVDVFTDKQNPYFVVIDELDTNWVIQHRKYHLIRALIETIKAFNKVKFVKIIIAFRTDLYDRIISQTRDEGFQHEKYETYLLRILWQKSELHELVNKRINKVFKSRYTKQVATFADIAPDKIGNIKCFDYLYERTFQRPRHMIMFINSCISYSVGKNKFTVSTVREAERFYSEQRYKAIQDEWVESYSLLDQGISFLERIKRDSFSLSSVSDEDMIELVTEIDQAKAQTVFDKKLKQYAVDAFCEKNLKEKLLANVIKMLYHVGIIGIKLRAEDTYDWYFENQRLVSANRIREDTSLKIHPMFLRYLGISSNRAV